jgi:hypothetical protein
VARKHVTHTDGPYFAYHDHGRHVMREIIALRSLMVVHMRWLRQAVGYTARGAPWA